jgi:iron complex outermembrane receptor protein
MGSNRRGRCRGGLAAALACGLVPAGAQAASGGLAQLSLEELSNLRVTSVSKRAERLSDAPTSVFVITADDIRRSGATTLPEALRLAPSLHVARAYARGHTISARGFNSTAANKLLVLIDGRSIYTPLFSGVFWDVQDVVLEDVDRIEVISGPGGTLWGVNAVNGVINVITRPAYETTNTLLSAGAGSHETQASLRWGAAIGPGDVRFHARRIQNRHTWTAAGNPVDDAGHHNHAGFRADWQAWRDEFTLHGDVYRGHRGQPLPGTIAIAGLTFPLGEIATSGANLVGRWRRMLGGDDSIEVQAYYDRTHRRVPPTFAETLQIVDLQLQHSSRPAVAHALVWGAQYRYAKDRLENSSIIAFLPARLDLRWAALFAQDEIALRENLRLTLGARAERNHYTGLEFLPNARLAWKLSADHLLWAAASRTVRAPSRLDRDTFVPGQPPFLLAGGSGVRSETGEVYELGYRGRPTLRTTYSVTAFRANYDHLRTQEIAPSGTFVVFGSGMEGQVRGLEMWGAFQASRHWRLSAGFTRLWQDLRLKPGSNDPVTVANAEGANPERQWLLRSSLDLGERTGLDATVRHVSRLRSPDVPSHTAVDVRFAWRPRDDIEVSITGQNLFDPGHGEFTAIATRTEFERTVFVKLTATF